MNKNWTALFQNHILARGFTYFYNEAVENLIITEKAVSATVEGTDTYTVKIELDQGRVKSMFCTCPYAEDGNHCKHMAAVLYAWEKSNEAVGTAKETTVNNAQPQQEKSVAEIVENADVSVVKKFLVSLLEENDDLLLRFKAAVTKKLTKADMKRLKAHVNQVARRHMDRFGFINYYAAGDFANDLNGIIEKDVRHIIDNGDYRNAFELLTYMFDFVANVEMDDSDGELCDILSDIYEVWVELLDKAGMEEKREMFCWFTDRLGYYDNDWVDEYIEDAILDGFKEQEFWQPKADMIKAQMEEAAKVHVAGWGRNYELGKWAVRYLNLINPASLDDPEFKKICKKYWKVSEVRRFYISFCIQGKIYDKALQVLDESIKLDKDYAGLISDYQKKKKEVFLLQGNRDAYIAQLWVMIRKVEPGNLELFRELKQQYTPEEWIEKRESVFKNISSDFSLARLYAEEMLLDRLLGCVMRSDLYVLQTYTKLLQEKYPEELLKKYATEAEKLAARSGTRGHYREIAGVLQTMQRIKGGKEVVKTILDDWREAYRRRTAMWDEFSRKKLK